MMKKHFRVSAVYMKGWISSEGINVSFSINDGGNGKNWEREVGKKATVSLEANRTVMDSGENRLC